MAGLAWLTPRLDRPASTLCCAIPSGLPTIQEQRWSSRRLMDQQGRLTQWNDARGFGFITPLAGGPRIFVHISQFQERRRRPRLHDRLTYVIGTDEQGRLRAQQVRDQRHSPVRSASTKTVSTAGTLAILGFSVLAVILISSLISSISPNPQQPPSAQTSSAQTPPAQTPSAQASSAASDQAIATTFQAQQSGLQIGGEGVVDRVLADDNNGSRHQRFVLRLASGQTLLIAHNIDLAPRIAALHNGDRVVFYGQYEWNAEGGVIHWTHRDPQGQHAAGWLQHNGVVYQ